MIRLHHITILIIAFMVISVASSVLWFFSSVLGFFTGLVSAVLSVTVGQMLVGLVLVAAGYGVGRASLSETGTTTLQRYDEKRGRWVDASKGKSKP